MQIGFVFSNCAPLLPGIREIGFVFSGGLRRSDERQIGFVLSATVRKWKKSTQDVACVLHVSPAAIWGGLWIPPVGRNERLRRAGCGGGSGFVLSDRPSKAHWRGSGLRIGFVFSEASGGGSLEDIDEGRMVRRDMLRILWTLLSPFLVGRVAAR
jgi:hypothetical protein